MDDSSLFNLKFLLFRVRVLCMWYNLTIQLNKKIQILGQILIGTWYIVQTSLFVEINHKKLENKFYVILFYFIVIWFEKKLILLIESHFT